jgi:hypothetical protein
VKVFVAVKEYDHESSSIIGVFTTEEIAKEALRQSRGGNDAGHDPMVYEFEIDTL